MTTYLELVTWADIKPGDHVWSMGSICEITRGPFRNDDDYDRDMRPEVMRFTHRAPDRTVFSPPMELDRPVPRVLTLPEWAVAPRPEKEET